jgi:plasmid maintenance system antidote protein VapI
LDIDKILKERNITKYRLSKDSGIPYTTINDICSGKAQLEKCSAETVYRISRQLHITMEEFIETSMNDAIGMEHRTSFETFKSNVCHRVMDIKDINFIIETLESDIIRKYFNKKWYAESLYLLAMIDYLSRENNIPLCTNYNDLRACKLTSPIFPASIVVASAAAKNDRLKNESIQNAIPEFIRFNIVESEVRSVI